MSDSGYEPWDVDKTLKDKIRSLVDRIVYRGVPKGDIAGMVDAIGKEKLAFRLAGTTDKKSRAYKTARDSLTRWIKGKRKPKATTVEKVNGAVKNQKLGEFRQRGSISVSVVGNYKTSKTVWKNGNVHASLTGEAKENFLAALESGDNETAIQIACAEYGLDPDLVENLEDITNFNIT
jgi:hypothetical protein